MDEPPVEPLATENRAVEQTDAAPAVIDRADGSVVIDFTQPAVPPAPCIKPEPDPLNHEIVVCGETGPSPRLGPQVGPSEEEQFGSAVPAARFRLSDEAEAQTNATNPSVGGFNAQGLEARLKIDF